MRSSQEEQEQLAGAAKIHCSGHGLGDEPSSGATRPSGVAGPGQTSSDDGVEENKSTAPPTPARQPEVVYVIDANVFIDIENGEKPELRRRLMREDLRLVTLNFLELCKTRLPSQVAMLAQPLRDFAKHGRRDKVKEIRDRLMKDETFLNKVGRSSEVDRSGVQALMQEKHINVATYVSLCLEAGCYDGCFEFRYVSSDQFISDISKGVESVKMNELKYVPVVSPKMLGCD